MRSFEVSPPLFFFLLISAVAFWGNEVCIFLIGQTSLQLRSIEKVSSHVDSNCFASSINCTQLLLPNSSFPEVKNGNSSIDQLTTATQLQGEQPTSTPLVYCEWTAESSLDSCFEVLSKRLNQPLAHRWYFLGDSTMFRLFEAITRLPDINFTMVREEKVLRKLEYYGWQKSDVTWVPPNFTNGEGPVVMVDRPFRMDCSNCLNREVEFANGVRAEWIGVEYSRDVEFPTPNTTTSQETAALYMHEKSIPKEKVVCVVNVGIHDMKIEPRLSTEGHIKNVRDYQGHLKNECSVFIWVSMSAVMGKRKDPQTNEKIYAWNQAILQMMEDGFYVDVYNKSLHTKHADNVHLDMDIYYKPLSRMFLSLLLKSPRLDYGEATNY